MGLWFSKLFDLIASFGSERNPSRILMVGLDNAGKTTILYKVKLNENVVTIPTIGFNVETVSPIKGVTFTVWDVGGQKKIRELWRHYYQNTQGVLYVVDSSDVERVHESREELFRVLETPEMERVPVVVIANKQDLPNALTTAEIVDKMELRKLVNRQWYVQASCAINGDGIYESMERMAELVNDFKRKQRSGGF